MFPKWSRNLFEVLSYQAFCSLKKYFCCGFLPNCCFSCLSFISGSRWKTFCRKTWEHRGAGSWVSHGRGSRAALETLDRKRLTKSPVEPFEPWSGSYLKDPSCQVSSHFHLLIEPPGNLRLRVKDKEAKGGLLPPWQTPLGHRSTHPSPRRRFWPGLGMQGDII